MDNFIDLHVHSSFSDGTMTPAAIVGQAKEKGLAVLALTDHDTTAGLPDFLALKGNGIDLVPGVELSAHHPGGTMHILGYGIQHENTFLQECLAQIQQDRQRRNREIILKLQGLGIKISEQELAGASLGQVGRPHIAALLVAKGVVPRESEAFKQYLRKGAVAYVARGKLMPQDAITMIRRANGLAVLAHPATLAVGEATMRTLIGELKEMGLSGVEVFHPVHSGKQVKQFGRLCRELQLVSTGGSDFHGRQGERARLGRYGNHNFLQYGIWQELKAEMHNRGVEIS